MKNDFVFIKKSLTSFLYLLLFFTASCYAGKYKSGPQIFNLDGVWNLKGYSQDKYNNIDLKAIVPGQVHLDLYREGKIENPFWRDNAEKCQWVENWQWTYKKCFRLPAGFRRSNVWLQFDGLDTYCDVIVNGRHIGECGTVTADNMFRQYSFNVTDWLTYDNENVIEVIFHPISEEIGHKAILNPMSAAFGHKYRSYVRRMQCTFGWDWVNRFVSFGIWKSCRIVSYENSKFEECYAYPKNVTAKQATVNLSVITKSINGEEVKLNTSLSDDNGNIVWNQSKKLTGVDNSYETEFVVKNPKLWWPNGTGKQSLYTFKCSLLDKEGNITQNKTWKIGLRSVNIEQTADTNIKNGSSFSVKINGCNIFAKGANWVPADPFPSCVTKEKYFRLLSQAKEAGVNMLRVWGGGIYESDDFYAICDSLGIMIWQEFMTACAAYPEKDKNFVDTYKEEVIQNVKRLRDHTSIIIWSGGNEIALNHLISDEWPLKNLYINTFVPFMNKLDPSRPFRLTSPYGNDPRDSNSKISGDAHRGAQYSDSLDKPDGYMHYRDIIKNELSCRFLSESATAGTPTKSSLLKFMTKDDLSNSEMFNYHTKDNPYTQGGLTLYGKLNKLACQLYGNSNGDVDRRLRQTGYIQYDFIRLGMEAVRSQKYYTSGLLLWMYNDCWPASGWSIIDYWGTRKAGWYGMKSGSKPVIAATIKNRDNMEWWICSDLMADTDIHVTIKIVPTDGSTCKTLYDRNIKMPANKSVKVLSMPFNYVYKQVCLNKLVVAEVICNGTVDRSFYSPFVPKDIIYSNSGVTMTGFKSGRNGQVVVKTDKWAHVVTLEGDADFDDNYFELLPGEKRIIKWKSQDGNNVNNIKVSAWN